nr:YpfJ protein, zinc metalloprotease superfamily [Raoultella sp. NCTC 9187]
MELQADCFAGVWGHSMQNQDVMETGDLQEALNAAEAIGDDRLQQQSQGRVVPDSFTHGTSQQRYTWFKPVLTAEIRRSAIRLVMRSDRYCRWTKSLT